MPTYMCTLKLPPRVIDQIEKYRKHALWSGVKIHRVGPCLAIWEIACRPKEEGGKDWGSSVYNMKTVPSS